jgi:hypothetical protein
MAQPANEKLFIKTGLLMEKTAPDVFHAIIDPEQMKNYFIKTATGPMEEGKTVYWNFP